MNCCKRSAVLMVLVVFVVVLMSQCSVEATRVLPEDFAAANHLSTLPAEYMMKAKDTMSGWFGMLASGPSPKGPGH
ncbi:hypothetical protein LguiA_029057 [Lonicera macranthoides]